MRFELFVALRYLFSRRKHSFISIISVISILGVTLGVGALIVVVGVMNGFSHDLQEKILGVDAHILVLSSSRGIEDPQPVLDAITSVEGVAGATPFIYSEVMLSNDNGPKGVILRGIDPNSASQVLDIDQHMQEGRIMDLLEQEEDDLPGIIIGHQLAVRRGIFVGDRVLLGTPSNDASAAGFNFEIRYFQVVGVFFTGLYNYDSSLVLITIDAAKELLGFDNVNATGVEVRVEDVYDAQAVTERINEELGAPFFARSWVEMNANLFAALKLEKTAMFIILTLVVMVGSFSIITTLVMLVMEKTKDIAILMSMGATTGNIRRIFIYQGLLIGFIGTALGYALGLGASFLLKKYEFIELPPDVYSLNHLPVRLEWVDLTVTGLAAMMLCFLATLYPAWKAARLKPADALRFE